MVRLSIPFYTFLVCIVFSGINITENHIKTCFGVCSWLECSSFTAFILFLIYDWHQIEYLAPRADHSQHLAFSRTHLPFLFRLALSLLPAFLLISEICLPPVQHVLPLLKFWANIDGANLLGGVLDNLCDFCVIYGEPVAYSYFRASCGVATNPVGMLADSNALIFLLEI